MNPDQWYFLYSGFVTRFRRPWPSGRPPVPLVCRLGKDRELSSVSRGSVSERKNPERSLGNP